MERQMYYTLNENKELVPATIIEFMELCDNPGSRVVEQTMLEDGSVKVSTVFLGYDHAWGDEEPLLFETMIFGGIHDDYQVRYTTWQQAVEGHKIAVDLALTNAGSTV